MNLFESIKACKAIDGITILNEVSLSISKGEKVVITGSNGSGKSSLLKLIGGIYEETSGSAKRTHQNIGYVPEHFPENVRFNIYEFLMFTGKMNGKSKEEIRRKIDTYADLFAISNFLYTPLKKCSKGTKQKTGIIQALLKDPDLLLLDEPLTGLDKQTKMELLNQLQSLDQTQTIVFTAHDSLLIDQLAEREIKIEGGRVISDSANGEKEKIRFIKANIPTIDLMTDISCVSYDILEENTVEIAVWAQESDQVLLLLLQRDCSIIEMKEKR